MILWNESPSPFTLDSSAHIAPPNIAEFEVNVQYSMAELPECDLMHPPAFLALFWLHLGLVVTNFVFSVLMDAPSFLHLFLLKRTLAMVLSMFSK